MSYNRYDSEECADCGSYNNRDMFCVACCQEAVLKERKRVLKKVEEWFNGEEFNWVLVERYLHRLECELQEEDKKKEAKD